MRTVINFYIMFRDLAEDICSVKYSIEEANSFQDRAETYFKQFKNYSMGTCTARKPYPHILREHISEFMIFYGESLGWGYDYFTCHAGEHLNKLIKTLEIQGTNLDNNRFISIMKTLRVKQLHFSESVLTRTVVCSRCKQTDQNSKNKNCPPYTLISQIYTLILVTRIEIAYVLLSNLLLLI